MKFEDKFFLFIFFALGLTLGLSICKLYPNLPFIKFDGEINIVSAASLFVTTGIALIIPLLLKKFVDDNRGVKNLIEIEIIDITKTLCEIKSILTECHLKGSITPEDKDKINYIFHTADLQIVSLHEQLKISFERQSSDLVAEIKERYFIYNEELTGGSLMTSTFNLITDDFRRFHDTELNRFVTFLKSAIHRIHRF